MGFENSTSEDKGKKLKSAAEIAMEKTVDIKETAEVENKEKFDIGQWHRKEVSVKRSDGQIERGWFVSGDTGSRVSVFKPEGDKFLQKAIPYEEFFRLNDNAKEAAEANEGKGKAPENEKEAGDNLEEKINSIENNREELKKFLDTIDGVQGSGKFYKSAELKTEIDNALNQLKNVDITDRKAIINILKKITRGGDLDLRNKVHQIFLAEKIKGM